MNNFTEKICTILDDKKARDITVIKIDHLTTIADYMIIACGKSTTQVRTLAEHLEDTLAKEGTEPRRKEGYSEGRWAVLDYTDVIVHIFHDDTRLYYCLEELWGDGKNLTKFKSSDSKDSE